MANILRSIFETDQSLESKGIVVEFAPGVEVTIARAGGSNKRFAKELAKLSKPYRRAIQTETIADETAKDLMYRVYAKTVVLGWKGFTKDLLTKNEADATTDLPCTEDNVIAVFKALPDLFDEIIRTSQNISAFRAEVLEADAGN